MEEMMRRSTPDFSTQIEADFVVSLKAKNGEYALFVEAFTRKNGKAYLRHTSSTSEALRMAKFTAFDVCEKVAEYRCIGRVERISSDGLERDVVTQEAAFGESTSPRPAAQVSQDGPEREEALADLGSVESTPMLDNSSQPVIDADLTGLKVATSAGADVTAARDQVMTAVLDRLDLMETRLITAFEQMTVLPRK